MTRWLGPVFQAELVATARKPRFFAGRVGYGLLVLLIVTQTYANLTWPYNGEPIPIQLTARFGLEIFQAFAMLQGAVFLVMTPALVAGAIADEKQRKTLHYLMASELSAASIILGKVGARLLRLVVLGLIGLPVLALVGLFGGIDYRLALLVYAATATTTFFLASLSILCSVYAAKPRDAIVQAFFFEFVWFVVPFVLLGTMTFWAPGAQAVGEFCAPALEWIEAASPLSLVRRLNGLRSIAAMLEKTCWMMGCQVVYGLVMLVIAAWRLRPVFRSMDGPGLAARIFRRGRGRPRSSRLRIFPRPAVGTDAMLWKELHVHRMSDARRIALGVLCVGLVGFVIYAAWDDFRGALGAAMGGNYGGYTPPQQAVNGYLRAANAVGMLVFLFGLGAVGASGITAEREGDTWINLASAPIEGAELVRSKIWGTLWTFRSIYATLGACWVLGLLLGSAQPLGVLACVIELAAFSYFTASLGTAISLRAKNTVQAMAITFGVLLATNLGALLLLLTVLTNPGPIVAAGSTPFLLAVSLYGGNELAIARVAGEMVAACVLGTVGYTIAAVILQETAVAAYDRVVDRPNRSRNTLQPEQVSVIQAAQPAGAAS